MNPQSEFSSIYIERNDCGNCYRCVRECVVKAIHTKDRAAYIDPQMCVECGSCLSKCYQNSVVIRDDIHLARAVINNHPVKIASVSPSWITEFPGIDPARFVETLKMLGFTAVSESALGAELTMDQEAQLVAKRQGISISSRCPAVVNYILKYKPRFVPMLLGVETPMIAHARMIKRWWGDDAHIVHISACTAAKSESEEYSDLVDVAITFKELKRWIANDGVNPERMPAEVTSQFEPFVAKSGFGYPVEGCGFDQESRERHGANGGVLFYASSMENIDELLTTVPTWESCSIYLDLMACMGGCMGSNGATEHKSSFLNRRMIFERVAMRRDRMDESYTLPQISVERQPYQDKTIANFVAESDTVRALKSLGIDSPQDTIDCNGCGYGTCRRFAKALSRGVAKKQMCIHFIQSELRARFSTLISRLAAGVAIVNDSMEIVEVNRMMATMMGSEAELLYDSSQGMSGISVEEVLPFSKWLTTMFESGEDSLVRDIQIKERILTVSIHSVQKHKMLLVICRNMLFSQVRNEEIVSRTQKVIKENLVTVQKIANLLGENASRTEAILNSILDSQTTDHEQR